LHYGRTSATVTGGWTDDLHELKMSRRKDNSFSVNEPEKKAEKKKKKMEGEKELTGKKEKL